MQLSDIASTSKLAEHAYYINMDHQQGRREHFVQLMRAVGLTPVRVQPVPDKVSFISGTKTHKLILETIAKLEGDQYHCVFEDDVEVAPGLDVSHVKSYIRQELERTQDPVGFIYLGVCLTQAQFQTCQPHVCNAKCAHAYMVTPAGARWLLQNVDDAEWESEWMDNILPKMLSPPMLGYHLIHYDEPTWRGLFYQARRAEWYEAGLTEG